MSNPANKFTIVLLLALVAWFVADDVLGSSKSDAMLEVRGRFDSKTLHIWVEALSGFTCAQVPSLGGNTFVLKDFKGEFVAWESPIKGPITKDSSIMLYEGQTLGFRVETDYLATRYELERGEVFRVLYSATPAQKCNHPETFVDLTFP